MNTIFAALAAGLFGFGTFLVLHRELTRMLIGLAMLAHGANVLLLLATRRPGRPAFVGETGEVLDPLPQAFALTAIVIAFGVTCFLLALAYRSWVLTRDDTVHDDPEDRRISTAPDDEGALR